MLSGSASAPNMRSLRISRLSLPAARLTRNPNLHFGYAAGGTHFSLGANVARREIRVLFEELHNRIPDIAAADESAILQSAFHSRHQAIAGCLDAAVLTGHPRPYIER